MRAGVEVGDRGQDGWMASSTQWTWVWDGEGQGRLMELQIVDHDLVTEQQQQHCLYKCL